LGSTTENALGVANLKKRLRSTGLLSFQETSESAMRQVGLVQKSILRIDLSAFGTTCLPGVALAKTGRFPA
jgi:hypothetical protein